MLSFSILSLKLVHRGSVDDRWFADPEIPFDFDRVWRTGSASARLKNGSSAT